jgi:hypothetical protein
MPNIPFWLAKQHYARLRRQAYAEVVRDAAQAEGIRVPLLLADSNEQTLEVWRNTWRATHPSGFGNWDWDALLRRAWRRPAAMHLAIWSGERLCGLSVGRMSRRRPSGVRHTISIRFIESAHERDHPLRHLIVPLAIAAAETYGRLAGAWRLRLMEPLPGLLRYYEDFGFEVARKAGQPVYCERRILP